MEELILLMSTPFLGDRSNHKEVDDICKPWGFSPYRKEILIRKCVTGVSHTCNMETR